LIISSKVAVFLGLSSNFFKKPKAKNLPRTCLGREVKSPQKKVEKPASRKILQCSGALIISVTRSGDGRKVQGTFYNVQVPPSHDI
jgi:hypothetical protein